MYLLPIYAFVYSDSALIDHVLHNVLLVSKKKVSRMDELTSKLRIHCGNCKLWIKCVYWIKQQNARSSRRRRWHKKTVRLVIPVGFQCSTVEGTAICWSFPNVQLTVLVSGCAANFSLSRNGKRIPLICN